MSRSCASSDGSNVPRGLIASIGKFIVVCGGLSASLNVFYVLLLPESECHYVSFRRSGM